MITIKTDIGINEKNACMVNDMVKNQNNGINQNVFCTFCELKLNALK